jgi:acetyltransferase-like isoleucine patch superfamily enzyme
MALSAPNVKASTTAMWNKLNRFWREPLINKLYILSTFYYKAKGIVFYRLVFKQFGGGSCIRKPIVIWNPGFVSIGDRVSIRDGARLEVVRSSDRRTPHLVIEDDTNIEQNVHIVCHNHVRIGSNVSIAGNCSIVDVTHPFSDVHSSKKIGARIQDENSFVEVGNGSFIGFGSVILPNVRIGTNSIIGANSVVTNDVPDYSVAAGVPAVILKRYDFAKEAWLKTSPPSGAANIQS